MMSKSAVMAHLAGKTNLSKRQTGEPIKIPAKRVCKFRLAKSVKDAVLGKK
jgi:nucleoid DNA-binding protein